MLALVLGVAIAFGGAGPVAAAGVHGGALNNPGERSHNVWGLWPELGYAWEGLVKPKAAAAIKVGVQVWPLGLQAGGRFRFTLQEKGRVSLALLVEPAFAFAGFGGAKATYPLAYSFGRSRTFRPSFGPSANVGLLATVDISPVLHLLFAFENPATLWFWSDLSWWVEWPFVFGAGVEYETSYRVSLFGRVGGGPSIAFSGGSQLLGVHWHVIFGAQFRY